MLSQVFECHLCLTLASPLCFPQMCLASEAGKMDTVQSYPEDSSSKASLQQTTIKPEIKEEAADAAAAAGPPSSDPAPLSSASPTSTDTDGQNTCVKDKSKKKEVSQSQDKGEAPCPAKKVLSECDHAEANTESVSGAGEKVSKQSLKYAEEKPRKKLQRSSGAATSAVPKKKSKSKVPEVETETEVSSGQGGNTGPPAAPSKEENKVVSPKMEGEEPRVEMPELQSSVVEPHQPHQPPCSPSPAQLKEDSQGKDTCEASMENCGSRKSERRCKGALYKTLVSEGMLTSLRANIDRGGCGWLKR